MCRTFAKTGECKYGDSCRHSHDGQRAERSVDIGRGFEERSGRGVQVLDIADRDAKFLKKIMKDEKAIFENQHVERFLRAFEEYEPAQIVSLLEEKLSKKRLSEAIILSENHGLAFVKVTSKLRKGLYSA